MVSLRKPGARLARDPEVLTRGVDLGKATERDAVQHQFVQSFPKHYGHLFVTV